MKATVWTSWDAGHVDGKPKCIFVGEISVVPHVGDYITLREGFGAEIVRSVTYDFVRDEVEISIRGIDRDNEYGACLHHA